MKNLNQLAHINIHSNRDARALTRDLSSRPGIWDPLGGCFLAVETWRDTVSLQILVVGSCMEEKKELKVSEQVGLIRVIVVSLW
jgi:hypothetical protein